jgi:hypothetical protein
VEKEVREAIATLDERRLQAWSDREPSEGVAKARILIVAGHDVLERVGDRTEGANKEETLVLVLVRGRPDLGEGIDPFDPCLFPELTTYGLLERFARFD